MEYEGSAFNTTFAKGKSSGSIHVSSEGIFFSNQQAEILLPLSGLGFELGGASNRILFITNTAAPDWKIFTSDQNLLKDPILSKNVALQQQLQGLKAIKKKGRMFGLAILAAMILGCWGFWFLKDFFVEKVTSQIPVEWEVKLGESAYEQFTAGKNIIDNEDLQKDLEALVAPLLKAVDNGNYKFQFHIIEDSTLNAAAFPGGHLIIHTGLILALERPEDLLGVLAHEIAHVNRRHSMQRLVNMAGMYVVLSSFIGDFGAISATILNGGSQLLALKNSRGHERDADEVGWQYLMDANINPRGLIEAFKKMSHDVKPTSIAEELDFLSTHPAIENRISYLEEKWSALENKRGFDDLDVNYENFQTQLRACLYENEPKKNKTEVTELPEEKLPTNLIEENK